MSVAHETLPLSIGELQRTREPLERATALPQAAFTDPRVLDWELEHVFMGGWICVGHVDQVRERGDYLMVELGGESVFVVGRRRRRPARVPEHLPPPRRAPRPGARGPLRAPAVPVPRLVLRLRRLAAQRAATPTRLEDFDPQLLRRCTRCALAVVEGLVLLDLSGEAPAPHEHVGDLAPALARYRLGGAAPRAADRLRRRRQLEGDRRELQRVPALPGRASRAQPPQPLPLGRDARGRGRVVRRLDDARARASRRWRRDGRPRAPADRRASPRTTSARSSTSCSSPTRWSRCTPTT